MGNENSRGGGGSAQYPGASSTRRTYVSNQRAPNYAAPGAYRQPPSNNRGGNTRYVTVRVPPGVRPGSVFSINADGTRYNVTCPPNTRPGETVRVELRRSTRNEGSSQQDFYVTVPEGVRPGEQFPVMARGHQVMVTCPPGVRPGTQVRITIPRQRNNQTPPERHSVVPPGTTNSSTAPSGFTMFEVVVPPGTHPGQAFMLMANNQRVMVTCPQGAGPGSRVRFQLPNTDEGSGTTRVITLKYSKGGWMRSLDTSTLSFMWVRQKANDTDISEDNNEDAKQEETNAQNIDVDELAFVRLFKANSETKAKDLDVSMVPAEEARQSGEVPKTMINFQDLSRAADMKFADKVTWFQDVIRGIRSPWEEGHMQIRVRRSDLLHDAQEAYLAMDADEFKKYFRFEFIGEPAIDAGGVAREFYEIVSSQLFDANNGLFMSSAINQTCMQVNPASGLANESHLDFFRFAGRLMGKALFDQHLVKAHLVRPLYKHILAWPVNIHDLEHLDYDTYTGLIKALDLDDVSMLCLDFTCEEERLGSRETVNLIPGGADVALTNDNMRHYLERQVCYRVCERVRAQLAALLQGFYDVIPASLLSVFDFQELEILMCGLPEIDMEDWKAHTVYEGQYESKGAYHKVIKWFWEVVEGEYNEEQRARLLQFVTGTSGVPSAGFGALQGNDGNIRLFTVTSWPLAQGIFPRSHTCFNRIDLPLYTTKKSLKKHLTLAISMEATGFDIE